MESNVNPGKAIKILAKYATFIYTSFDATEGYFNNDIKNKLKNFGNPIRKSLIDNCDINTGYEKFGLDKNKRVVLIFGGSLGARAINNAVIKWLDNFSNADYQILWQTGNNFNIDIELPQNIIQTEFIDDMSAAYSVADLVVSRSGATTVAELCIVGKPAILIPLPSASNKEQYYNAKYLEDHNAAIIVNNEEILDHLYPTINDLMQDKNCLDSMSTSLKSLARPDASIKIASDILKELNVV